MILSAIFIPLAIILIYVVVGRRLLKKLPFMAGFFAWIEPAEILLWRKSETILWARTQQLGGAVFSLLSVIGVIDLSPFLWAVPEKHRTWVGALPSMAVSVNGIICELQRRQVSRPLELVAVPDNPPPIVAAAMVQAEVSKDVAIAVVQAEKKP